MSRGTSHEVARTCRCNRPLRESVHQQSNPIFSYCAPPQKLYLTPLWVLTLVHPETHQTKTRRQYPKLTCPQYSIQRMR